MRPLLVLSLFVFCAPAFAERVAAPPAPNPCADAKKKAVIYSMGLRAYCAKDEDCAEFNVTGDQCDEPLVFRKDAHVTDDKNLSRLQDDVKKACEEQWSKRGVCPPDHVKPACRDGKCVEVPDVVPAAKATGK